MGCLYWIVPVRLSGSGCDVTAWRGVESVLFRLNVVERLPRRVQLQHELLPLFVCLVVCLRKKTGKTDNLQELTLTKHS